MRKLTFTTLVLFAMGLSVFATKDPEVKEINKTLTAIVIDGEIDAVWEEAMGGDIDGRWLPAEGELAPENCSGAWKMLYDDDYLYLLIEVMDDVLVNDGEEMNEHDDGWDIPFDLLNEKTETPLNNVDEADKLQYSMLWGNWHESGTPEINPEVKWSFGSAFTAVVEAASVDVDGGYIIEFAIDLYELWPDGVSAEQEFGLGVRLNDDDAGGDRENMAAWDQDRDPECDNCAGWNTPSTWGTAMFVATEVGGGNAIFNTSTSTFKVFPNPATDVIRISDIEYGDNISVLNMVGQEVLTGVSEGASYEFNVEDFAAGLYMVKVGDSAQKIIIR